LFPTSICKPPAAYHGGLPVLPAQATRRSSFILGDLFEYWAGDDDLVTPYNRQIAAALKAVQAQGVQLFWMAGNRDFLVGRALRRRPG
jgi:UDP-2,3-diacylglucosamine hydrolase